MEVWNYFKMQRHTDAKTQRFLSAFTLAEVLITLGIIGVVATMTITVLVPKIQDMQFKEAAKEAYSKASQAVQLMKQDGGESLSTYLGSNNWYYVLRSYFKIAQDCGHGDSCVSSSATSTIYNALNKASGTTYDMDNGQFFTTDGMFWGLESTDFLGLTVDVNGYLKGPNVFGRDVFVFQVLNDNLIPMGGPNSYFPSDNYCLKNGATHFQGLGCMSNVMQGIDY